MNASINQRLDMYVAAQLPAHSRSVAGKLISSGAVEVNGIVITKAGHQLKPRDAVYINTSDLNSEAAAIDLEILYEDENCVIISKPTGVLTHSKGTFNPEATVATWLRPKVTGLEGERAGIVHRLDRATSGVMICAKNPSALSWLQKQFAQRRVKKTYVAVVQGTIVPRAAIIDMPIERNPKKPQTFRVGSNGKPGVTAYRVTISNGHYSLLELKPETGRTHQLRVHLKQLGHPIIGDVLYGGQAADRLYLHAAELELTLPDRSRRTFSVAMPHDFKELIS